MLKIGYNSKSGSYTTAIGFGAHATGYCGMSIGTNCSFIFFKKRKEGKRKSRCGTKKYYIIFLFVMKNIIN
jgi:hypothetical protein